MYTCETAKGTLADWAAGRLTDPERSRLEAHLEVCRDCAQEAEMVQALRQARPEPPPGLLTDIQAALRQDLERGGGASSGPSPREARRWWSGDGSWRLAAAAVVVLALGTAVIWPQIRAGSGVRDPGTDPVEPPLLVETWGGSVGIVAGVPVLEQLSDEELLSLLEELEG